MFWVGILILGSKIILFVLSYFVVLYDENKTALCKLSPGPNFMLCLSRKYCLTVCC